MANSGIESLVWVDVYEDEQLRNELIAEIERYAHKVYQENDTQSDMDELVDWIIDACRD